MKMMKKLMLASAVSFGALGAGGVLAATDGDLSATSTGNFDITFVNGDQARIWGLEDINLADSNGSDGTEASHDFCIFSNKDGTGSNEYELSVASSNNFSLVNSVTGGNDPGNSLDYKLSFTDPLSNNSPDFTSNGTVDLFAGSLSAQPDPGNDDCASQGTKNKTTVKIQFVGTNASIGAVASGAYYDLVTLVVSPK